MKRILQAALFPLLMVNSALTVASERTIEPSASGIMASDGVVFTRQKVRIVPHQNPHRATIQWQQDFILSKTGEAQQIIVLPATQRDSLLINGKVVTTYPLYIKEFWKHFPKFEKSKYFFQDGHLDSYTKRFANIPLRYATVLLAPGPHRMDAIYNRAISQNDSRKVYRLEILPRIKFVPSEIILVLPERDWIFSDTFMQQGEFDAVSRAKIWRMNSLKEYDFVEFTLQPIVHKEEGPLWRILIGWCKSTPFSAFGLLLVFVLFGMLLKSVWMSLFKNISDKNIS